MNLGFKSRMIIVFLLSLGTYWNVYHCDFVFDDHMAIRRNLDVDTSRTTWTSLWSHDFWGKDLKAVDSHKSWRPLTILSFRIDHYFFEFNASYYHVTNSILHALVSVGVLPFCFYLFHFDNEKNILDQATMASILFAVHPVHVEAVVGTVGRADILCAGFSMLAFVLHRKGFPLSSILILILATLCKDTGITLIVVLAAQNVLSSVSSEVWLSPHRWGLQIWSRIVFGYIGVLIMYMYVRGAIMHDEHTNNTFSLLRGTLQKSDLIRRTENPFAFTNGTTWILSTAYLHGRYAKLLVFPTELCAEYSYNCIPVVEYLSDTRNLLSLLSYCVFIFVVIYGLAMRHEGVLLCVLWICMPMIPASNLFMKVGTLLAERLLYVPSLGFCCLVTYAVRRFFFGCSKLVVWSLFGAIVVTMINRSQLRTQDWYTDESLFESAVEVCPQSAKMQQQLGQVRLSQGRTDEALRLFRLAQSIDPEFCDVKISIANVMLNKKDVGGAVANLQDSLHCVYTSRKAWDHLSRIWQLGLKLNDKNATLYEEMADTMATMGGHHEDTAILYYREAGVLLLNKQKFKLALSLFRRGLKLRPERCDLNYWIAILYQKKIALRSSSSSSSDERKTMKWRNKMIRYFNAALMSHCNDTALSSANELIGVFENDYARTAQTLDRLILARPDVKSRYARTASKQWEFAAMLSKDKIRAAEYYANSIRYESFSSCTAFEGAYMLSASLPSNSGVRFETSNGNILDTKDLEEAARKCKDGVNN